MPVTDYYTHNSSGGKNLMRQLMSSDYGAGLVAKREFFNLLQDTDDRLEMIERGAELLANTD
jgi:hypothetical protein